MSDARALLVASMDWNWAGMNDSVVEELLEPVLAEIDRLTAALAERDATIAELRNEVEAWNGTYLGRWQDVSDLYPFKPVPSEETP